MVVWDFWTINSIVKALSTDAFIHAVGISYGDEHVTRMIEEVGELLGCLNWTVQIYKSLLQRFNESCGNGEQPKVWLIWYRQNIVFDMNTSYTDTIQQNFLMVLFSEMTMNAEGPVTKVLK